MIFIWICIQEIIPFNTGFLAYSNLCMCEVNSQWLLCSQKSSINLWYLSEIQKLSILVKPSIIFLNHKILSFFPPMKMISIHIYNNTKLHFLYLIFLGYAITRWNCKKASAKIFDIIINLCVGYRNKTYWDAFKPNAKFEQIIKTRKKGVHKNVSQGCN